MTILQHVINQIGITDPLIQQCTAAVLGICIFSVLAGAIYHSFAALFYR